MGVKGKALIVCRRDNPEALEGLSRRRRAGWRSFGGGAFSSPLLCRITKKGPCGALLFLFVDNLRKWNRILRVNFMPFTLHQIPRIFVEFGEKRFSPLDRCMHTA
jgi:hypothetical protein